MRKLVELSPGRGDPARGSADFFESSVDARFSEYIARMRTPGVYGDHLTLVALSHLLLREIRVIRDTPARPEFITIVSPPPTVSREAWGTPIHIVHYSRLQHFEGTAPKFG